LEIVSLILRTYDCSLNIEEQQALAACALVCKSWLPLAQRSLYRSLIVDTGPAYSPSLIPGALVPEVLLQRSHLLVFTRSFSIYLRGESLATPFSEDNSPKVGRKRFPLRPKKKVKKIPDFFLLLAHTLRLQHLTLVAYSPKENIGLFEPHILRWLSSLVLPVEVLTICGGRNTFVYDLVGILPTIRALHAFPDDNDNGPPPKRANIRLRELTLLGSNDAIATATLEWLLPPPPPNEQSILRFLSLDKIPEEARAVLSVHGPSVSTLTLECQPHFEIAPLFTNLEELVLRDPSWSSPLPALPRTLKHIRLLSGPVDADMSQNNIVVAFAQVVPTLPDLRMISMDKEFTANVHYPHLRGVCETHKVEILAASSSVVERPVVSAYERSQLVCDICHSLTTAISIPITQRWIAFLDSTHFPNFSTFGIEVIEKIFGSLGGARTNSSLLARPRCAHESDHMGHSLDIGGTSRSVGEPIDSLI
jgi:hypothetical protein